MVRFLSFLILFFVTNQNQNQDQKRKQQTTQLSSLRYFQIEILQVFFNAAENRELSVLKRILDKEDTGEDDLEIAVNELDKA
jgi:hypothetical protein